MTAAHAPLPFHVDLCAHLQRTEPEAWAWFASTELESKVRDDLQLMLLKSCVRLDGETFPAAFEAVRLAAERVGVDVPVTLYQAEGGGDGMNASIFTLPDEAHLVLVGPILDKLTGDELLAMFGHELSHHALNSRDDRRYLIGARMLDAMASDLRATEAHLETWRRYRLSTEIFCDRGAAVAAEGFDPAVACLVKVGTGLSQVNPRAYLEQAREIVEKGPVGSAGISHPETYIRTLVLDLWASEADDAEATTARMVCGLGDDLALDILEQERITGATQELISGLLAPAWFRSDAVVGHARSFFPDLQTAADPDWEEFFRRYGPYRTGVERYLAAVLLDFTLVDRDLDDPALAHALVTARAMELEGPFLTAAFEMGKITKKRLREIGAKAEKLLADIRLKGGGDG